MHLQIPICSKLLLCQKERWQTLTSARLPPPKQMDEEKQERIPTNKSSHQLS